MLSHAFTFESTLPFQIYLHLNVLSILINFDHMLHFKRVYNFWPGSVSELEIAFVGSPDKSSLSLTRSLKLFITQMHDRGFGLIGHRQVHAEAETVVAHLSNEEFESSVQ